MCFSASQDANIHNVFQHLDDGGVRKVHTFAIAEAMLVQKAVEPLSAEAFVNVFLINESDNDGKHLRALSTTEYITSLRPDIQGVSSPPTSGTLLSPWLWSIRIKLKPVKSPT